LIRHSTDIYMLSLFAFDMIMATAKSMYVKWIHEGKVYTGDFCTAQGIVQQLGDTGSALATLAIAIHTFVVALWGIQPHQHSIAYAIVGLTWIFVCFFVGIGVSINTRGSNFYESPVGYWCWIGNHYLPEQLAGQYIWVWVTMVISFLAYTTLFFWARGNISVSQQHWWKFQVHSDTDVVQDIDPGGRRWRSFRMIVYPIVFAVIALPLSVVRWRSGFGGSKHHLPTATFAVEFLYSLSGVLNVLLFLFTRSDLLLPRNRLGVAPRLQMDLVGFPTVEGRQREGGHEPVPVVPFPGMNDTGWQLPTPEHNSNELNEEPP